MSQNPMRRALLLLSVLACALLVTGQVGSYLEFVMVPAPTAATTGPQGAADVIFGLLAVGGGALGLALSVVTAIVGLAVVAGESRRSWLVAIVGSSALVLLGLGVSVFVLLGMSRNPYHPFTICIVVPLTTLTYLVSTRKTQPETPLV